MKALVVLSGGQDSTTALFDTLATGYDEVHCLTVDYGQRHAIEVESAKKVVEIARQHYPARLISHEVVAVPDILISSSPLTSTQPLEQYENFEQMDKVIGARVELTFVPARNPFFLTLAANRAVYWNCSIIVTGICQEDNANYPDCRESFRSSFEHMLNCALSPRKLYVYAPLMNHSKAETVRLARTLPGCWEALAYTHTSYDGQYPPTDKNHANVLRAHGFEEAGFPDPLVLRAWREGLMELPNTPNYDKERHEPPTG